MVLFSRTILFLATNQYQNRGCMSDLKAIEEGALLWKPSDEQIQNANLTRFRMWINKKIGTDFQDYHQLWEWSVTEIESFWELIAEYYDVTFHTPYKQVLMERSMPGAVWFEGATLNFAEYIFTQKQEDSPAILFKRESQDLEHISWDKLEAEVQKTAAAFRALGVQKGDRIAAYLPNIPEAIIGCLAAASMGAIWSSCSPDFGSDSVIERFSQIDPVLLLSVDGYSYGGKSYNRMDRLAEIQHALPSLKQTILLPYLNSNPDIDSLPQRNTTKFWKDAITETSEPLRFEPVSFDHPLWVLYSSGTTGLPKPITHGHGGMLLEKLKYMDLHADVSPGDRFFWFTTTGWMMWNVVLGSLLRGATAVLYDGSPAWPDLNALWKLAEQTKMTTFGTSATYLMNCKKMGLRPSKNFDLLDLRSVGSTGSPLPPEGFNWVYDNVGKHILLNSTSGGTDICSSFVGGNTTLPVHAGEIQCRTLGTKVESFDEQGQSLIDEVGEMVITEPLPHMPVYFWGDEDGSRYRESYFEMYPGVWRHGDWIKITHRSSCVIYGRSDATLNRMGVRIGTSEIYRAVEPIQGIKDSLIISMEKKNGDWYMPLFVLLEEGKEVTEDLKSEIKKAISAKISPRFIPDEVLKAPDIPYTLSGKKMEKPIKRIMEGIPTEKAVSKDSMRNPEVLSFFEQLIN